MDNEQSERVVRIVCVGGDYIGTLQGEGFKDESRQFFLLRKATILQIGTDQNKKAMFNLTALKRVGKPPFFNPDLEISAGGAVIWEINEGSELYKTYREEVSDLTMPRGKRPPGGILLTTNN